MTTKKTIEKTAYNCPECGTVIAKEVYIEHFLDESAVTLRDRKILVEVIDYGACKVAASARVPGHPMISELAECPIFKENLS